MACDLTMKSKGFSLVSMVQRLLDHLRLAEPAEVPCIEIPELTGCWGIVTVSRAEQLKE